MLFAPSDEDGIFLLGPNGTENIIDGKYCEGYSYSVKCNTIQSAILLQFCRSLPEWEVGEMLPEFREILGNIYPMLHQLERATVNQPDGGGLLYLDHYGALVHQRPDGMYEDINGRLTLPPVLGPYSTIKETFPFAKAYRFWNNYPPLDVFLPIKEKIAKDLGLKFEPEFGRVRVKRIKEGLDQRYSDWKEVESEVKEYRKVLDGTPYETEYKAAFDTIKFEEQ